MNNEERRKQFHTLLADEPNDAFLRYGLAMTYVSDGDDRSAVREFQEMFQSTPDYVPAYLQAGQAYLRLGEREPARDVFTRGIATANRQGDQHAAGEMQGFLEGITP